MAQAPLAAIPTAPSPSTWQPLLCFLSLWICLFWTFPINGLTQHVAFHVWLLSLSMLFSGFVHIIACVGAPSLWPGATPLCRSCLAPLTQHAVLGVCHIIACVGAPSLWPGATPLCRSCLAPLTQHAVLGVCHIIACVGAPSLWPGATPLCRYIALHPFVPVASLIVQMVQNLPAVKETRV